MGVEYAGGPGAEQLSEMIAQTGNDTESNSELDALEPSTKKDRDSSMICWLKSFTSRNNATGRGI